MNSPQQFLYKIQPTRLAMLTEGPTAEEDRLVGEHLQYLKGLMEAGVVKLAGRTLNDDASTFGIVIFEAADTNAAHAIADNDPAVRHGVMRAEIYPFRIALMAQD